MICLLCLCSYDAMFTNLMYLHLGVNVQWFWPPFCTCCIVLSAPLGPLSLYITAGFFVNLRA